MQKKLNRIYDGPMQTFLFWLCWLVYFASYIGRLNYSSAMPAMIMSIWPAFSASMPAMS